jgi:hypothetical protein
MALRHLGLQTCKQFQQQPRRERDWRANDEDCERNTQDDQEQRTHIDEKPGYPARSIDDRLATSHCGSLARCDVAQGVTFRVISTS